MAYISKKSNQLQQSASNCNTNVKHSIKSNFYILARFFSCCICSGNIWLWFQTIVNGRSCIVELKFVCLPNGKSRVLLFRFMVFVVVWLNKLFHFQVMKNSCIFYGIGRTKGLLMRLYCSKHSSHLCWSTVWYVLQLLLCALILIPFETKNMPKRRKIWSLLFSQIFLIFSHYICILLFFSFFLNHFSCIFFFNFWYTISLMSILFRLNRQSIWWLKKCVCWKFKIQIP